MAELKTKQNDAGVHEFINSFADTEQKQETRTKASAFIRENGTKKFASSLFPSLYSEENRKALSSNIETLVEEAAKIPAENAAIAMEAMRDRPDRRHVISKLEVPILYIMGQSDTAVPVEQNVQECFYAKDSTLVALENTGHMGMFEAPQVVTKRIKEFLKYCHQS